MIITLGGVWVVPQVLASCDMSLVFGAVLLVIESIGLLRFVVVVVVTAVCVGGGTFGSFVAIHCTAGIAG